MHSRRLRCVRTSFSKMIGHPCISNESTRVSFNINTVSGRLKSGINSANLFLDEPLTQFRSARCNNHQFIFRAKAVACIRIGNQVVTPPILQCQAEVPIFTEARIGRVAPTGKLSSATFLNCSVKGFHRLSQNIFRGNKRRHEVHNVAKWADQNAIAEKTLANALSPPWLFIKFYRTNHA